MIKPTKTQSQDCLPIIEACDSLLAQKDKIIKHLTLDRDITRNSLELCQKVNENNQKQLQWQKIKTKISNIALILMAICGSIAIIFD
jgi:hypothetical protein